MKFLTTRTFIIASLLAILLAACTDNPAPIVIEPNDTPTVSPLFASSAEPESSPTATQVLPTRPPEDSSSSNADQMEVPEGVVGVQVDIHRDVHPINPLIYGLSGASAEHIERLRPTLTSWGGNPSTRYNWELGNAWNAGRDWFFRNGNYGYTGVSASDEFIAGANALGLEVRFALPNVWGWVDQK